MKTGACLRIVCFGLMNLGNKEIKKFSTTSSYWEISYDKLQRYAYSPIRFKNRPGKPETIEKAIHEVNQKAIVCFNHYNRLTIDYQTGVPLHALNINAIIGTESDRRPYQTLFQMKYLRAISSCREFQR